MEQRAAAYLIQQEELRAILDMACSTILIGATAHIHLGLPPLVRATLVKPRDYSVKAQAGCATHTSVTSTWSNPKSVTIVRPKKGKL